MSTAKTHEVTLIPGDWIGPETCEVVKSVVAAAGVDVRWDEHACPDDDLSDELLASVRRTGCILKGKLAAHRLSGHLPPTIQLRMQLKTWATVRSVQALAGSGARFPDIDVVVIRETSEDIFSGMEHTVADGVYEAVKVTTAAACERIARFAYEYARRKGRKKVTIVHKSNIMKQSDGLFLRTAQKVGAEYPDVQTDEVIVDALCMRLVRDPSQFDVLLTGNLFGDIVSDLCSGLGGGITAGASYSRGDDVTIFENPYGEQPELVGTGRANPVPMLMTAYYLLRYLEEFDAAGRIRAAIEGSYAAGIKTTDDGGDATCAQVQQAIISRL